MKTYLEVEEVKKLESAATCVRDQLLIRLLFRLGCRISEALALKVEDIDFKRGVVTIAHLKARLRLSCPKCNTRLAKSHTFCPGCAMPVKEPVAKALEKERRRVIPLDKETLHRLREFIRKDRTKGLIFKVSRTRAWQIITGCAVRAGLPELIHPESGIRHHVSAHRLRDAFAVQAVKVDDSGDGLRLLQQHLGHQNINTTMRYRKVSGKEQREWLDKVLEEIIHGRPEPTGNSPTT